MTMAVLLLVLAPLWIAALLVLISFPLAWWIFPGGGSRGPGDTLASRVIGNALAVVGEWLAGIWVVLVFPYAFYRNDGPRRSLPEGRRPVFLLPGHSENALTLYFLERRLEQALGTPVRALKPRRYYAGLENLAEDYRMQISAWMDELDATQADLVGHSMGGILARYLVESGGLRNRVRAVISVGTPHLGSVMSRILPGRNARQMRRGSAFLENLNSGNPPKGIHFAGICSTHDNLVIPWHCGLSPRGDNFIIRYRGHLSLLFSKEVIRLIAKELREL